MLRSLRLAPLVLALAGTLLIAAPAVHGSTPERTAPPVVARADLAGPTAGNGRVVFKLRDGVHPLVARWLVGSLGLETSRYLARSGVFVAEVGGSERVQAVVTALLASGMVDVAVPDVTVTAFDAPDDPNYPRQWHLANSEGGMWAEAAWDLVPGGATGVVVAVIDTGAAFETRTEPGTFGTRRFAAAPDLAGVPIVAPWNFLTNTTHAGDDHGHGTHVAGTIVQATNNGYGVAGVARGASLMPLKILDYSGSGSGADLVESLYYAVDHGADVINMSLGFSGSGQPDANGAVCGEIPGLHEALDYAATSGVVVVAASGNDGASTVACPAAHPTVISVGATRLDGLVTFYSNRGAALDITAPGGDPNTDLDRDGDIDGVLQETYCADWLTMLLSGDYTQFCNVYQVGTSMASPHVAGTAALLLAVDPTLSPLQVRYLLETTARDRGDAGWDSSYGHGALDARAAVASLLATRPPNIDPTPYPSPTPYPVPAAPSDLVATALSSGSVRLTWTDNATGEQGVRVERAVGDGFFQQVGTVSAVSTTYTSRGLQPGTTYRFRVVAYDAQGYESPPSGEAVATTFPLPAAPSDLVAQAQSASTILLTWTDNATTETGYRIERSTDGATFVFTGLVSSNTTRYTAINLEPGTSFWFRVRATDGESFSEYSNVATATTFPPPEAPGGLVLSGVTASSVSLRWSDNSATEQGFRIERSLDGGVTFQLQGILPANWTTYTGYGLAPDTDYRFRVVAYAGTYVSAPSNEVATRTLPVPAAPTDVAVTGLSATRVLVTWTDNATTENGYRVERSTDGTVFVLAAILAADTTSLTVSNLAPDTRYWFRVRASDGTTFSDYSPVASGMTLPPPAAPSGLSVSEITATTLLLRWVDNSTAETGFRVERSADGGVTFQSAGTVPADRTELKVTGLESTATYLLRVVAYDGSAESAPSAAVAATTLSAPPGPSNLQASGITAASIRLTWVDNATTETGFAIERSLDGGTTWTRIATMLANSTTFTNYGLAPATAYWYRVMAMDGNAVSATSNVVTAVTNPVPAAPTGLQVTVLSATSVRLAWTDNATTESGYRVERSLNGTTWTQVGFLTANATTWTNTGLTAGTTYFYRVRANDVAVYSDYSEVVSITMP